MHGTLRFSLFVNANHASDNTRISYEELETISEQMFKYEQLGSFLDKIICTDCLLGTQEGLADFIQIDLYCSVINLTAQAVSELTDYLEFTYDLSITTVALS
jgi:hypothetical protein